MNIIKFFRFGLPTTNAEFNHSNMRPRHRRMGIILPLVLVLAFLTTGLAHGDYAQREFTAESVINLSSLVGPSGFRIDGHNDGDQAGRSLGFAGDVNGDGLNDLIIGAPSANPENTQNAGEAYVIFGRTTNPASLPLGDLNGTNGFRIVGVTFNDEAGSAVSGGGDVNNDGYDDLIIGAPGADLDELTPEAGAVFVVFGQASFPAKVDLNSLNGASGFRMNGIVMDDRAGAGVNLAKDVNGDGFDDILIGAPDASPGGKQGAGQIYVVWGKQSFPPVFNLSTLNGTNGFIVDGVASETSAGKILRMAGDLNKDGYGDFLLSAGSHLSGRSLDTGTVFVVFGQQTFPAKFNLAGINGTNGFRIEGIADGDNAGRAVAAAGDVNGDGRDDLVIGAPYASDNKGEAYIVFGRTTYSAAINLKDLNGLNGVRLIGDQANGEAGTAVSAADINGDGLQDVVIGASAAGSGSSRLAGMTYVVFGRANFGAPSLSLGALGAGGLRFDGAASSDQSGQTLGHAGDFDGDGYDEILIGAPNAGPGVKSKAGFIYLVQGGPTLGVSMPATHSGTPGNNNLSGTSGNDVMLAHRGDDQINAVAGNDVLKGGAGNDIHNGGSGADRIIGGTGKDTASYADSAAGVNINLFTGIIGGGDATGDSLVSIEHLIGSNAADTLIGDTRDNMLTGAGGSDSLTGGLGNDTFMYSAGSGADTITDFMPGSQTPDLLDFTGYPAITGVGSLLINPQGADTLITLPGSETILLKGVTPGQLHADDYRFTGMPVAKPDHFTTSANTELQVNAPGVLANDVNPGAGQLTAVIVNNPTHGTLTLQANGGFTYTPNKDFIGGDEFAYQANNGQLSNITQVTIDVTPIPPTALDDSFSVDLGDTLSVPAPGVLANDLKGGNLPMQAILVEEPVGGSLTLNSDGSFTYTPDADYDTQDSFTYQASNGLLSNIATVTIAIIIPDGPPVAFDDAYELSAGDTLVIPASGVLENDINPLAGVMTAKLVDKPEHGSLALNANGGFSYQPNTGFVGQDHFTYRADNGQLSNIATVSLEIISTPNQMQRVMLPVVLYH
ncbi:MAG TPA: Ig-like domain-containing protein [Promineifilum sp.]|nr:Ig-like domain-containing protein [Promineifilum sp.]HRO91288.1 Ig-like domain-containing protein [Promineifilum sp.]HRQ13632.1 Ig-like domain-containing protein [Promineifilum sp.]